MISGIGNNDAARSPAINHRRISAASVGFTLIELLIVVVIISMLITAAIPVISKTSGNFYFRNKAKQVEMLFGALQKTAIMEAAAYKLLINFTENKLTVWVAGEKGENFIQKQDALLNGIRLGQEIALSTAPGDSSNGDIIFSPDGTITSAALYIKDTHNNTARLSTTLSGEINLEFL